MKLELNQFVEEFLNLINFFQISSRSEFYKAYCDNFNRNISEYFDKVTTVFPVEKWNINSGNYSINGNEINKKFIFDIIEYILSDDFNANHFFTQRFIFTGLRYDLYKPQLTHDKENFVDKCNKLLRNLENGYEIKIIDKKYKVFPIQDEHLKSAIETIMVLDNPTLGTIRDAVKEISDKFETSDINDRR